jgi:hypothetical protein
LEIIIFIIVAIVHLLRDVNIAYLLFITALLLSMYFHEEIQKNPVRLFFILGLENIQCRKEWRDE